MSLAVFSFKFSQISPCVTLAALKIKLNRNGVIPNGMYQLSKEYFLF